MYTGTWLVYVMYTEHSAYSLSYAYRDVYITESAHRSVRERE